MSAEPATAKTSLEEIRAELARTKLTASTMNFVVWIDDADRRDWILERTALLSDKHPSLTIVLDHTGSCEHGVVQSGERRRTRGVHRARRTRADRRVVPGRRDDPAAT